MATIHLVSPQSTFGPWDWRNPDDPGIGGSETMHCEMAWRLAARGHHVISYAPLPQEHVDFLTSGGLNRIHHRGVEWRDLSHFDPSQPGLYILIRGIELLDQFEVRADQRIWCVFQDVDYPGTWKEAWESRVTRILGLCHTHCTYLKYQHPPFAAKVWQSRNGIRGDLVDQVLSERIVQEPVVCGSETDPITFHGGVDSIRYVRNPHRLTYASSPDRGLWELLQAFRLIRFLIPDAELHVFYGWDNIDKLPLQTAMLRHQRQRLLQAAQYPGVVLRGRCGQPTLYREWLKTGLMVAPTNFTETGHITVMEAQALGAIPIVNPLWATGEQLLAGFGVPGDATDPLTLRRFAMAAVHLMQHPEGQEELRGPMMQEARKRFDWEGVVDQYEAWMAEDGLS